MNNQLSSYRSLVSDLESLISDGRKAVYQSISDAMVELYWNIGRRIVEEEQGGAERAKYGTELSNNLADDLTAEFGAGFTARNLRNYRQFFIMFPEHEIWHACVPNLTWTHFRSLLRVKDEKARLWYLREASQEGWSSRTLDRNISTQYYYRLLKSPKKDAVIAEMKHLTEPYQKTSYELIKSPVIAEFLGFKDEDTYLETDLESAILSHIRDFLMEMGRGFAFVARQQHIVT